MKSVLPDPHGSIVNVFLYPFPVITTFEMADSYKIAVVKLCPQYIWHTYIIIIASIVVLDL